MIKKLTLALTVAVALPAAALTAGDIAFTSFNADEDGFSLVTFVDLAAGSAIHFSDNEWSGSAFNTGEGQMTWNVGANSVAAGQVIRFAAVDKTSRSVSVGTLSAVGDNGINATNETIYAFLGADSNNPSTFLAGVSSEGATNLTPAGLVAGSSAVVLTNSTDYAAYQGARSGEATFAAYRSMVNNASNWTILVGGDQASQTPDTTAFSVTAVPEPRTYALMLAGLAAVGLLARRRA